METLIKILILIVIIMILTIIVIINKLITNKENKKLEEKTTNEILINTRTMIKNKLNIIITIILIPLIIFLIKAGTILDLITKSIYK